MRRSGCSECLRFIRLRPGVVGGEQCRDHRIRSGEGGSGKSGCNLGRVRYTAKGHDADWFALAFVVGIKEGLVFDDGAAERRSKLVVVEWSFRLTAEVEVVAGIECVVAEVLRCSTVKRVGAALGHDVDYGAGVTSVFRLEVGKYVDFGDGVDRQNCGRRSEHASLVDGRVVAVSIVHVGAVEKIVVGAAAGAVHGEFAEGAG